MSSSLSSSYTHTESLASTSGRGTSSARGLPLSARVPTSDAITRREDSTHGGGGGSKSRSSSRSNGVHSGRAPPSLRGPRSPPFHNGRKAALDPSSEERNPTKRKTRKKAREQHCPHPSPPQHPVTHSLRGGMANISARHKGDKRAAEAKPHDDDGWEPSPEPWTREGSSTRGLYTISPPTPPPKTRAAADEEAVALQEQCGSEDVTELSLSGRTDLAGRSHSRTTEGPPTGPMHLSAQQKSCAHVEEAAACRHARDASPSAPQPQVSSSSRDATMGARLSAGSLAPTETAAEGEEAGDRMCGHGASLLSTATSLSPGPSPPLVAGTTAAGPGPLTARYGSGQEEDVHGCADSCRVGAEPQTPSPLDFTPAPPRHPPETDEAQARTGNPFTTLHGGGFAERRTSDSVAMQLFCGHGGGGNDSGGDEEAPKEVWLSEHEDAHAQGSWQTQGATPCQQTVGMTDFVDRHLPLPPGYLPSVFDLSQPASPSPDVRATVATSTSSRKGSTQAASDALSAARAAAASSTRRTSFSIHPTSVATPMTTSTTHVFQDNSSTGVGGGGGGGARTCRGDATREIFDDLYDMSRAEPASRGGARTPSTLVAVGSSVLPPMSPSLTAASPLSGQAGLLPRPRSANPPPLLHSTDAPSDAAPGSACHASTASTTAAGTAATPTTTLFAAVPMYGAGSPGSSFPSFSPAPPPTMAVTDALRRPAVPHHTSIFYPQGMDVVPPIQLHYLQLGAWRTIPGGRDFFSHRRLEKHEVVGHSVRWLHTARPRDRFVFLVDPVEDIPVEDQDDGNKAKDSAIRQAGGEVEEVADKEQGCARNGSPRDAAKPRPQTQRALRQPPPHRALLLWWQRLRRRLFGVAPAFAYNRGKLVQQPRLPLATDDVAEDDAADVSGFGGSSSSANGSPLASHYHPSSRRLTRSMSVGSLSSATNGLMGAAHAVPQTPNTYYMQSLLPPSAMATVHSPSVLLPPPMPLSDPVASTSSLTQRAGHPDAARAPSIGAVPMPVGTTRHQTVFAQEAARGTGMGQERCTAPATVMAASPILAPGAPPSPHANDSNGSGRAQKQGHHRASPTRRPKHCVEAVEVLHNDVTALDYHPRLTSSRLSIEAREVRTYAFPSLKDALLHYACPEALEGMRAQYYAAQTSHIPQPRQQQYRRGRRVSRLREDSSDDEDGERRGKERSRGGFGASTASPVLYPLMALDSGGSAAGASSPSPAMDVLHTASGPVYLYHPVVPLDPNGIRNSSSHSNSVQAKEPSHLEQGAVGGVPLSRQASSSASASLTHNGSFAAAAAAAATPLAAQRAVVRCDSPLPSPRSPGTCLSPPQDGAPFRKVGDGAPSEPPFSPWATNASLSPTVSAAHTPRAQQEQGKGHAETGRSSHPSTGNATPFAGAEGHDPLPPPSPFPAGLGNPVFAPSGAPLTLAPTTTPTAPPPASPPPPTHHPVSHRLTSVHTDTVVSVYTADPNFNAVLRELLLPDPPGTHPYTASLASQRRMLALYETGMPSWTVFLAASILPYRRSLRLAYVGLVNLWPLVSLFVGVYDLYKHLPQLKRFLSHTLEPLARWVDERFTVRVSFFVTYLVSVGVTICASLSNFFAQFFAVQLFSLPLVRLLFQAIQMPFLLAFDTVWTVGSIAYSFLRLLFMTVKVLVVGPFLLVTRLARLRVGASVSSVSTAAVEGTSLTLRWWRAWQEFWLTVASPTKNLAKAWCDSVIHLASSAARREASIRRWYSPKLQLLLDLAQEGMDILRVNAGIAFELLWRHGYTQLVAQVAVLAYLYWLSFCLSQAMVRELMHGVATTVSQRWLLFAGHEATSQDTPHVLASASGLADAALGSVAGPQPSPWPARSTRGAVMWLASDNHSAWSDLVLATVAAFTPSPVHDGVVWLVSLLHHLTEVLWSALHGAWSSGAATSASFSTTSDPSSTATAKESVEGTLATPVAVREVPVTTSVPTQYTPAELSARQLSTWVEHVSGASRRPCWELTFLSHGSWLSYDAAERRFLGRYATLAASHEEVPSWWSRWGLELWQWWKPRPVGRKEKEGSHMEKDVPVAAGAWQIPAPWTLRHVHQTAAFSLTELSQTAISVDEERDGKVVR